MMGKILPENKFSLTDLGCDPIAFLSYWLVSPLIYGNHEVTGNFRTYTKIFRNKGLRVFDLFLLSAYRFRRDPCVKPRPESKTSKSATPASEEDWIASGGGDTLR
jgi:hypothetical protein